MQYILSEITNSNKSITNAQFRKIGSYFNYMICKALPIITNNSKIKRKGTEYIKIM